MKRIFTTILTLLTLFIPFMDTPDVDMNKEQWNTNYKYVFVHGLSGWGSYDFQYKIMPYWGMFGGDLMKYLEKQGYNCYAASVDPQGSAWDRACELYAQLTGTVTDYGKAHSERCSHNRYGTDFSKKPLINEWDSENKINLLGHSFGGATVRMLVSLMTKGSEEEIAATPADEISPLFTGGKSDYIYSVVSLAAPHNGTASYNITEDENVTMKGFDRLIAMATKAKEDGRSAEDYANYDMYIDNALALNQQLALPENIYYFSVACSSTVKNEDGTYSADNEITEFLFRSGANQLGRYSGTTRGGYVIDESWFENDGLVNTKSALYPEGQPHCDFDEGNVSRGIWNVMPVYRGDHMSLQGDLFLKNDIRAFYAELLDMINSL